MIQVTTLLTVIQHLTMIECICECDQDLLPATMELPWAEAASTTETSVTILAPSLLSISVTGNRVSKRPDMELCLHLCVQELAF